MEIIEQLRFIFIIFMAFLSYRHVSNQPLAICQSDSEEEDIILEDGDEAIIPEAVADEPSWVEEEQPEVSINEALNPISTEGIEVLSDEYISIAIENQESLVECSNDQSEVLGERVNEEAENPTDKIEKTKPIKKTWKRAKKFSEKTEGTVTQNQQNEADNRVQVI